MISNVPLAPGVAASGKFPLCFLRDVETKGHDAIFAAPDPFTVEVEFSGLADAFEFEEDLFPRRIRQQPKCLRYHAMPVGSSSMLALKALSSFRARDKARAFQVASSKFGRVAFVGSPANRRQPGLRLNVARDEAQTGLVAQNARPLRPGKSNSDKYRSVLMKRERLKRRPGRHDGELT